MLIHLNKTCAIILIGLTVYLVISSPARAQGFGVGLAGHDHIGSPGDVITGSVEVTSSKDEVIGITVSSGDWLREPDVHGNYQWVTDQGRETRSLLKWLSYSPDVADLPAKGNVSINYQIHIPNDQTLTGSYWGVLFVSSLPTQEELQAQTQNPAEKPVIGINIVFRYCTLITVTISGSGPPQARFTKITIEDSEAGPQTVAEIQNSSATLVKPLLWLQVRDTAGSTVYNGEKLEYTLLPESKRSIKISLTDKPMQAGQYLLLLVADYGAPKMIGAQAKLSISPEQAAMMREIFQAKEEARIAREAAEAAAAVQPIREPN